MTGAHLKPTTIVAMWVVCGAAMGWANYRSITEAWSQASARHRWKDWRFVLSLLGREQIAYAKRLPMLLAVLLLCCLAAYLTPGA